MAILVMRPNSTVQNGSWVKTPSGGTLHGILSDNSDATFVVLNGKTLIQSALGIVDFADIVAGVDIPAGAKILSMRARARAYQVTPPSGSSFSYDPVRFYFQFVEQVIHDVVTGNYAALFRHIFGFNAPNQPPGAVSPTWSDLTFVTFLESPSGGEWTVEKINATKFFLGRIDNNPYSSPAKMSEIYMDVEYNEAPTVAVNGPTEVRTITDGVTTNASTTLTSATANFTSNDVGASVTGSGIPALTTIASRTNSTTVVLSAAATATATGVSVTITRNVITATTRPLVTFDYSDPENDPQSAFRAKVFTQTQVDGATFQVEATTPFTQVDWVAGQDEQWLVNRDLPNDDYVVYVQVRQLWRGTGEHRSEWGSYAWTQAVPGPPAPILTATANTITNWIQLDMTPSSGSPATETYNVEYSDNSGLTWQLIRNGFQILADGVTFNATVYDYEAPLNVARWYRAAGYRTITSIKVAGDFSNIEMCTAYSTKFWLKDPASPALNMPIVVYDDKPKQQRSQGVFAPLSAAGVDAFKIVVSGPRYGIEGTMTLVFVGTDDASGFTSFNDLVSSGRTLLIQYPTGEQHYIRIGSEVSQEWGLRTNRVHYRKATFDYFEVVKPDDTGIPV